MLIEEGDRKMNGNNMVKKQVDATHYEWGKYLKKSKWESYFCQINEIVKCKSKRILVIGKGDGIVPAILINMGMDVVTFDYDETLHPDIVGDVKEIDRYLKKGEFDTLLCCEVLEHIEFTYFEMIIKKFSDLEIRNIVLSLPNYSKQCCFDIKIRIGNLFNLRKRLINYKKIGHTVWCKDEHYWEVNVVGTELYKIQTILMKWYMIQKMYYVFENEYHIFFVLRGKY